jgi:hypothetical protein
MLFAHCVEGFEGEVVGDADGESGWVVVLERACVPALKLVVDFGLPVGFEVEVDATAKAGDGGVVSDEIEAARAWLIEVDGAGADEEVAVRMEAIADVGFCFEAEEVGAFVGGGAAEEVASCLDRWRDGEVSEVVREVDASGEAGVAAGAEVRVDVGVATEERDGVGPNRGDCGLGEAGESGHDEEADDEDRKTKAGRNNGQRVAHGAVPSFEARRGGGAQ